MPRFAGSYFFNQIISIRGIISRGYSAPTLQEIRSSDNRVNTTIAPESGWNYEAGFRIRSKNDRIWWDASAFYYKLENAITRNVNAAGQEFFLNSGGTDQKGIESLLKLKLIKERNRGFLRGLDLNHSYTFNYFKFLNQSAIQNFVTGAPSEVAVTSVKLVFLKQLYLFLQYNHTSRIPVNDANSEFAREYRLVQVKAGWIFRALKFSFDLNLGVDNLLDEKYSLGNDLNAVGNRYYNTAAPRNFFARITFIF